MSKRKSDYIAESLSEGSYGSSSMEKFVAKDEAEKPPSPNTGDMEILGMLAIFDFCFIPMSRV